MSLASGSASEWEAERQRRPPRVRGPGIRIRAKSRGGKGKRTGREACAVLRLRREEGEGAAVRRPRGGARASREAVGDICAIGGHGLVGDDGWRLTALRAAKDGESSPPSSGPGEDDWLAARGSVNPTDVGMAIPQMQANTRQRHDVLRPTARHYADQEAPVLCIDDATPQT